MTEWLRTLDALLETQIWFLAWTLWLTTTCNYSSRRSGAQSWLPWAPDPSMMHRYTCRQNTHTHTHKINRKIKSLPTNQLSYDALNRMLPYMGIWVIKRHRCNCPYILVVTPSIGDCSVPGDSWALATYPFSSLFTEGFSVEACVQRTAVGGVCSHAR